MPDIDLPIALYNRSRLRFRPRENLAVSRTPFCTPAIGNFSRIVGLWATCKAYWVETRIDFKEQRALICDLPVTCMLADRDLTMMKCDKLLPRWARSLSSTG